MQSDDITKNIRKSHSFKRTALAKREKIGKPIKRGLKPKVNDFTYFIKDLSLKRNVSVTINWK
jgi:hypothetical protein